MTPEPRRRPRPIQFGTRTLLTVTAALAVLLGMLQWMQVEPWAMAVVLGVVVLSGAAAVGLVLALAATVDEEDDHRPGSSE